MMTAAGMRKQMDERVLKRWRTRWADSRYHEALVHFVFLPFKALVTVVFIAPEITVENTSRLASASKR